MPQRWPVSLHSRRLSCNAISDAQRFHYGGIAWTPAVLFPRAVLLLAWLGGVLFIPSLAVALGTLTSRRKPFEVIYVTWMYLVLNEAPPLDFVGVTANSPWPAYMLLAAACSRWLPSCAGGN